jgi:hypothetical protein
VREGKRGGRNRGEERERERGEEGIEGSTKEGRKE